MKGNNAGDSCVISMKRIHNNARPEYQKIQFLKASTFQKFISLSAFSADHMWTKIRATYDETDEYSYFEIYQNVARTNWWLVIIEDAIGAYEGNNWKAIWPTLTQETVSGVTVHTSLDLPANNPT